MKVIILNSIQVKAKNTTVDFLRILPLKVISSDPVLIDGNARFTTVPLRALADQMSYILMFGMRIRFQGYRVKSRIAIFATR